MKNILSSLNESEKKRILEMHLNKNSFLLEAVENKTVQLDCVAKTVNGIVVSQANLLANLCPAIKNTTAQAGTTPKEATLGMPPFNITLEQMKAAGANSLPFNREGDYGMAIYGPGQNQFECYNNYYEYTYRWMTKDPDTPEAVRTALKPIYMKQCQTNLTWKQKMKQLGKL